MPLEARLEAILAEFQAAAAACATPADVARTRQELHRAVGMTGRSADAVAMIDGAVVPQALWEAYAPRFADLHTALDTRTRDLQAAERAKLERRRVATLQLWYPAQFSDPDTDEPLGDVRALERCDGVRDRTDLDSAAAFDGSPSLPLPVEAVVRFDPTVRGLFVVLEVPVARRPTTADVETIAARITQALYSGWGLNYDFAFPDEICDHVFHFKTRPSRHDVV